MNMILINNTYTVKLMVKLWKVFIYIYIINHMYIIHIYTVCRKSIKTKDLLKTKDLVAAFGITSALEFSKSNLSQ